MAEGIDAGPEPTNDSDSPGSGSPDAQTAEIERLREELQSVRDENSRLQDEQSKPHLSHDERTRKRSRRTSIGLAILAALLLPLGLLTLTVRSQLLNTNRYVETMTPLASDPAVKASVVNRITKAIVDGADFQSLATQVLPDKAQILAGPIASGAESLTRTGVTKFVDTKQFRTLWTEANRLGHEGLVKILKGEAPTKDDAVATSNGQVVLRMGPLVKAVIKSLDARFRLGLADRIPAERINFRYVIIDSPDLAKLQGEVRLFNRLSWLIAALAVAAVVGSALVAEDHRVGVRRAALALAGSMFVMLLGYEAARAMYLGHLPATVQSPAAAAAVFDIVTRFTHQNMKTLFTIGAVLLLIAWLVGPSGAAQRVRGWWGLLVGRVGDSHAELGPVPGWVAAHEGALRATVVVAAAGTVVLWNRPTGRVVLVITVVALVAIGLVQLLAAPARRARVAPSGPE